MNIKLPASPATPTHPIEPKISKLTSPPSPIPSPTPSPIPDLINSNDFPAYPVGSLAAQVQENLLGLETSLLNTTPDLPVLLRTIHKLLLEDPEVATLLSEKECGILVAGLKEHTKVELACTVIKKKGKKLKATTLDDL